ncbi:M23 family metallopeptidase [Actinoplanes sp. KI2]|uniref:M23 family metallopeptidase n=1 Tax=Actinoplanes sp. KI2 TaxID=2983315 RepID=UPI0021D57BEC|nr:M23 family metallopeptidase [Actinoplanes sp. KI2]MCU7728563.1 M23 family metallopeptidase [Actinoplanes sp. KI2]
MLTSIRKVVLVGLSVAAIAACSSQPKADPVWAGSTQGLDSSATPTPEATGDAAAAAPLVTPSASASASPSAKRSTPATAPTTKTVTNAKYTFPVTGGKSSYAHTHHDYPATDVITACGHTFVAVTNGVVLYTKTSDTWTAKANLGATRGGLSVAILGDDGVRYYGSHLASIASGIKPGVRVKVGQTLAKTGDTGDASACHLHFGISPPCAKGSDWWNQRGTVYPWPYLDSWKAGGNKSPVAAVKAWKAAHGCPTAPTVDK